MQIMLRKSNSQPSSIGTYLYYIYNTYNIYKICTLRFKKRFEFPLKIFIESSI